MRKNREGGELSTENEVKQNKSPLCFASLYIKTKYWVRVGKKRP